jgi:hypothetical protein
LTVEENAGIPENYEYREKKKEIYYLKYIAFEIFLLSIRFHKIVVCELTLHFEILIFKTLLFKALLLNHFSGA